MKTGIRYHGMLRLLLGLLGVLALVLAPFRLPGQRAATAAPAAPTPPFTQHHLLIGAPGEDFVGDLGLVQNAGVFHLLYGVFPTGLTDSFNQLWSQDDPYELVEGVAENGDMFGYSLVAGDFNGDGLDDVVVGLPYQDVQDHDDAGAVHVFYGFHVGWITGLDDETFSQDSNLIKDVSEPGDHFGQTLEVGDFNGDGYDDLAISVPGEDVWDPEDQIHWVDAGAVHLLYGSPAGLTDDRDQWIIEQGDELEHGDLFGTALAAGDFNADGFDDLAIGAPGESFFPYADGAHQGQVFVWFGDGDGFWFRETPQRLHQNNPYLGETPEADDYFGQTLESGDFNGDGFDDLVIGVPGETVGVQAGAGALHVLYGAPLLLSDSGAQLFSQDTGSLLDAAESGDNFAAALSSGDFNGDGYDDLAVGVPYEDVSGNTVVDGGAVQIIMGGAFGLTDAGNQYWDQNEATFASGPAADDRVGFSLAAGDYDSDGYCDLAIGIPFEDWGPLVDSGYIQVLYGGPGVGLSTAGIQYFHQDVGIILDSSEAGDLFGYALAAMPDPVYHFWVPLMKK